MLLIDRPVDRGMGRSTGSVDRQARLEFPFRIQIPFLDGIKSNLGFLKSRDFVAIKERLEPSYIASQSISKNSLKFPSCISCIGY